MSVRGWCEANGVPVPTMYSWIRVARERGGDACRDRPTFVEIAVCDGGSADAGVVAPALIVARVGGVELLLHHDFDESDAAAAMRAAASL